MVIHVLGNDSERIKYSVQFGAKTALALLLKNK